MSGFGIGIGAFVEGMMKGYKFVNDQKAAERKEVREDRRLDLEDKRVQADADFRKHQIGADNVRLDLARQGLGLQRDQIAATRENTAAANRRADNADRRAQGEYDTRMQEHNANAPLREATRESGIATAKLGAAQSGEKLDALNTMQAERTKARAAYDEKKKNEITIGAGENGAQTFSYGGKTYDSAEAADEAYDKANGSFYRQFMRKVGPAQVERMAASGDVEGAKAYKGYLESAELEDHMDHLGKVYASLTKGDWSGTANAIKEAVKGKNLLEADGLEIDVQPVKDKKGSTVGMRLSMKGADGNTQSMEFNDINKAMEYINAVANPTEGYKVFQARQKVADASRAKLAEKRGEAAIDVETERAKAGIINPTKILIETTKDMSRDPSSIGKKPEDRQREAVDATRRTVEDLKAMNARGITPPGATAGTPAATAQRPRVWTGQ
jgi:hypothetical protein